MAEFESLAGEEPIAAHLQRHRTDRLIMLSDGIFAIATTLAALEIRLPERADSLATLLSQSGQTLGAYLLSFVFTAVFWIANRELFARIARTDTILTLLTLGSLGMIAVIPAAVHMFYAPGGLGVGFSFYSLVMCLCGLLNSGMWIYAAARPGVMRDEIAGRERWARALSTIVMPALFLLCLFLDRHQLVWVMLPAALCAFVVRRVIVPRFAAKAAAKAVDRSS